MISSGWAKTYVYERDFRRLASYRKAQAAAKAARRGVWRRCGGNFRSAVTEASALPLRSGLGARRSL